MQLIDRRLVRCAALALASAFASCSGSAGPNGSISSGPSALGVPPVSTAYFLPGSLPAINTSPGGTNGLPNQFLPLRGDTLSGGRGTKIDNKVPCLPQMSNEYHVHAFLGIVENGKYVALPRAIGMVHPGVAVNGYVNSASCFYEIHTHDSTGIVHVEAAVSAPLTSSVFSLKNVLDVWGQKYGKTQFGSWSGPIHVFVGRETALGQTTISNYTAYPGLKYWHIKLYSHEVIWIEIGNGYYSASQLPPVTFYMEF